MVILNELGNFGYFASLQASKILKSPNEFRKFNIKGPRLSDSVDQMTLPTT